MANWNASTQIWRTGRSAACPSWLPLRNQPRRMVTNLDIRWILARMYTQSVAKLKRRTGDV